MQKITVQQAADRLGVSTQAVRVMVQNGVIEGAKCWGPKARRTYYITDTIINNFMEGRNE